MVPYITPNWYPSLQDIKPNPNSPFTNTPSPPKVFIDPLIPKEINYQHVCSMLQYTQSAKKKSADDKKKIIKDLEIALMRLRVGGGEGEDERERMRKVVVLEKTVRVHENFEKHLDTFAVPLRLKEEELKSILKEEAWENGNADYYEGCDFWFKPMAEDEEVMSDDELGEIDGMEGLEIDGCSDYEDTEM